MVVIAINTLPHYLHQLSVQVLQAGRDAHNLFERYLTDVCRGKPYHLTTVHARSEGIQTYQVACQMEAKNLLLAALAHGDRLERTVANHEHRGHHITDSK